MKFEDYKYEHLDAGALKARIGECVKNMREAANFDAFKGEFDKLDKIYTHMQTMFTICEIRHTVDTKDKYYADEWDYLGQMMPVVQEALNEWGSTVLDSPYRSELEKTVPSTYFLQAEFDRKSFDAKIIEDLQKENKLASDYQALIASAEIEFDGKTYTLASLEEKKNDADEDVRKRATLAYWGWLEAHDDEIGRIYDELVHVRDNMAKKLGFKNYIELGYLRMYRFDYGAADVSNYRRQILKDVVPVCNYLYERQAKRMGFDKLAAWNEKVEFSDGNPRPKHDKDELVRRAQTMYKELSPETGEFFDFMVEHNLLDLLSKPGKAAGGYCTFVPDYKSPFIFANFNNTQGDAEVLTHEAGHAFQTYESQNIHPAQCIFPTYETCEIHSMSMEFFTYPWMKSFFEEDTDKYYFSHLSGAVKFLPYGICVDHFQHEVYEHPEWTHAERKACWRRLEKEYLPHKDYEGADYLESGAWWVRQLHIFMNPFYYVDYTLAQVCALQFWARLQGDEDEKRAAFEDYKHICKIGGTMPFRQVVKEAGLKCPFDEGCLTETMAKIADWFQNTPDPQ